MKFLLICIALVAAVPFGEAVDCKDRPKGLEYMEPEGCWWGPEVYDYDAQFECENYMLMKRSTGAYTPEGRLCVMNCVLTDGEILKDMKLDRQKFLQQVKKRTHIDFKPWETPVQNAINKCFDFADKKLATLNGSDFDEIEKCNPVPKSLYNCISIELLVNGPRMNGPPDMFCSDLIEFYKTCDYVF